jgi:hypothetical protein
MHSMTWTVVPARRHFADFKREWDALNRTHFQRHPLLDSRFVEPLLEHFAGEREILAVHGDPPSNMLVLATATPGLATTFLPSQAPIGLALLSSLDDVTSLFGRLPGLALALELYCQDPDYSRFPEATVDSPHELTNYGTTVSIELESGFDAYWSCRPPKFRKNIERAMRRTRRPGGSCRFVTVDSPAEIAQAVDRFGDLEVKGWKGAAGTAVHRDNAQGCFYSQVLRRFAADGRATVYELYSGDALIASQLAIGNEQMLVTLKTTHDESFRGYSPGHSLDYLMLQHEFARKQYQRVEFYTNASSELQKWGTATRDIQHITFYRSVHWRFIARAARAVKRTVRSRTPATFARGEQRRT